jgi:hypothetical protein
MSCPINKLPAELLENVLLLMIGDPAPPVSSESEDGTTEGPLHRRDISATLAFRATLKSFHDRSWRAFAKVIDCTTFDLPSRKSVENLEDISTCVPLAPWITRINTVCQVVPKYFPFDSQCGLSPEDVVSLLDDDTARLYQRVKLDEDAWYAKLW